MTHCADGTQRGRFGAYEGPLVLVGWLESGQPYAHGPADPELVRAFFQLCQEPWGIASAGLHRCDLCVLSGGPGSVRLEGVSVWLGARDVFVPAGERVYVAQTLALHYLDWHEYRPPEDFRAAVLACPPMRSMAYLAAIRAAGLTWPRP